MFKFWKKRSQRSVADKSPARADRVDSRSGGEDGAGPAIAGPAEDEAPERESTRSAHRRYTPEERQKLVAAFLKSGLGATAFSKQEGVPYSTFQNWVRGRGLSDQVDSRYSKRFSPEERRAAVEAYEKSGRKRKDFARLWGCSPSSLDKWQKRYREEGPKGLETRKPPKGRRAHHPKRLSEEVRDLIVQVRTENNDFGVTSIANYLKRFHGLKVSVSGVRKILRERGVAPQPSPKRKSRPKSKLPRRFERARAGEMWQSDITSFMLRRQGRRVYLTVFLDDHSRYVVAWALATHQRTPLVTEPLLEGIARFGKPREVLTDQGRQYFAWRGKSGFQKLLAKEGIAHVVSRTHHPQTLGKCERLWKTVGDEFWDRAIPQDLEDARQRLAHWFRHYNHFRPHQGIDGLVPADRFFHAEGALRETLEREYTANELRLALDQAPRTPVYLVGQIGDERVSLHGERGHLVIDTPHGGRRELSMHDLGITHNDQDTKDSEHGNSPERTANSRNDADSEKAADTDRTQTKRLREGSKTSVAGARALGERAAGGESAGARDVHESARVLAGQEEQSAGGERTVDHDTASVAAEPAGAVGNDGGAFDAAASPGGARGVREELGTVRDGAQKADHRAGEGAVEDGGLGARLKNCPVAESSSGVAHEGRLPTCPQTQEKEQGEQRENTDSESGECSEKGNSRRGRFWRWLKPKA